MKRSSPTGPRIEKLATLVTKVHLTDAATIQIIQSMSEPCFEALCKFLTRHQKNGLRLRSQSTAFKKLVSWIAINSNKESAAIKALEAVSDATIVFAMSKKGSRPLSSLWDFLDTRIQFESKKQVRERNDFDPNMRVSPTARRDGSHHMKPGHT